MKCKWYATFEGVCTNGECPYRGDVCPTSEHPEVCKYSENTDNKYEVSELVKILRCCSDISYVCEECPANLDGEDCDGRLAKLQAADMLEKLAAEKDEKKPEPPKEGRAMKTPDEIKRAVRLCILSEDCKACPYYEDVNCSTMLMFDVFACIEAFEAEREEKSDE